jgi:hypothetical protein
MVAITDFMYVRKLSKHCYFNKALAIDNQNRLYWKRFASINKQMNFCWSIKAVEFGETGLDNLVVLVDILQFLSEFEKVY